MSYRKFLGAVAAFALAATALLAPAASASPAPGAAGTGSGAFLTEARTAGLTATEAKELQESVNTHLVQRGGTQIAANKIEYKGGYLLLKLPGEKYARELDQPVGTLATCPYLYFCAFDEENYAGNADIIEMYDCGRKYYIPFVGNGSWINNQTPGTRARFLNGNGSVLYTTPGAYSADWTNDWTPIYHVIPC